MAKKVIYFLLFLSFLISMKFWLGWEERARYIQLMICALLFFLVKTANIQLNFSAQNVGMFITIVLAHILTGYEWGYGSGIYFLLYLLIICLNDSDKIGCLKFITKWYGYLLVPGLIVYILLSFINLPSFGIQRANLNPWAIAEGYGVCDNYIFYMSSTYYEGRFNGPFLEPGHVGMISAFLLLVNKFDFKRKGMWQIFVALFFTLSLAGYMLAFISLVMILVYRKKIKPWMLMLYAAILLAICCFGLFYNNGDNIFYERILSRLEPDEDKGIAGNNRVFGQIELYFLTMWNDLHTMLWGYSKETMEVLAETGSRGTGFTMWMCSHGLIGTIAVLAIYIFYYIRSKAKSFARICLIFIGLMFWQRSYPFWTSWIICYVYGIVAEENYLQRLKGYESRNPYISQKP